MTASLRALLTGIIDYAGLFPPAQLTLEEAVRSYARYREKPESWMLGRFICPAGQLEELWPFVGLFQSDHPLPVSVLGAKGSTTHAEFLGGFKISLAQAVRFRKQWDECAIVDVVESKMPLGVLSLPHLGTEAGLAYFFEMTPGRSWHENLAATIALLTSGQSPPLLGFKLRCGGLEAAAFPPPEQVALTVAVCRDAKVPLKFTAGLHHPIRHFNDSVQTRMHGFINVFVAGVMAHARGLKADELQPIIEEENPAEFVFIDDGVRWRDCFATTGEIVAARQHFVTSFGSCSFDEPREDLRALGWM